MNRVIFLPVASEKLSAVSLPGVAASRFAQMSRACSVGEADVGLWRQFSRRCFLGIRNFQRLDELEQDLLGDGLAARQRLEFLVGFGNAIAAHDGLHSLCEHFPGRGDVGMDRGFIDLQFADTFQQRLQRDNEVADCDAEISLHGRIGEVALPARDRQFLREVAEQGIGQAEIAFGIFEIDRVDLVRHRRRADFVLGDRLLEVTQRNIAPDVAAKSISMVL